MKLSHRIELTILALSCTEDDEERQEISAEIDALQEEYLVIEGKPYNGYE